MNIERNDIDALNAELSISIAREDYAERVDAAIKKHRKSMNMPGFRPGHVPINLIKQRFGKSILAEEINQVLQDQLYKYIADSKIEILGSPIPVGENDEVGNWDDPGDFRFRYQLGLAPSFQLDLNKDMHFEYLRVNVDDKLIDRQVKDLARRYGKMSDPEVSEAEDLLMAELTELDENGDVKEGGINNKSTVSIEFVPNADLKAKLTGLKVGDELTVDPHHLTENHEDLAKMLGITHHALHDLNASFRLKVTEIKRIAPHPIDQELFDKLYGEGVVKSEEEMRGKVRAELEKMFERDSDFMFKKEFARKITEMIDPKLPDSFLKRYIQMTNEKPVTEEMVEHDYPYYAAQLRWELIEGRIIRQYELRVAPEEALDHVKQVLAARYGQYGLPLEDSMLTEFAKKTLGNKDEAKNVYDFLYEEKMITVVKDRCTLKETSLGYEEFVNRVQHAG